MERYRWDDLPSSVTTAVRHHVGEATVVREVEQGQNCNVALVLRGDDGDLFLKGVRGKSPRMRWLRNESEAGTLAPGLAPATRFSEDIEADELWFLVGFEYVNGRAADFAPGSDDLAIIAATAARISELPGGGPAKPLSERWTSADWWTKLATEASDEQFDWDLDELTEQCRRVPEMVKGDALIHTDLHEHQFMIDDGGSVRVIDWGRPATGAAWVDTAFLVIRLVAAGHAPREAEEWAVTVPSWSSRSEEAVTAFACYVAGLWGYRAATSPFPGATRLRLAAEKYLKYRLSL
ncbi:phosphotransferase [Amycolatopsis minnesotensis]|uniref:Aminoglycoside phosphotransferase domain-containing protein n=1 Tax=Amycolatopsis minnesotensis TaxID=337894 RepID=A0ABN2Q031_9PSEU